jgi:hypothetical protein
LKREKERKGFSMFLFGLLENKREGEKIGGMNE